MSAANLSQNRDAGFAFDFSDLCLPSVDRSKPDNDRSVPLLNNSLVGQRILLVVTGGIAAYKTPGLVRLLRSFGAEVDVRISSAASKFVGEKSLEWAAAEGKVRYAAELSAEVEHLANYSMFLVAPATYNFINGIASGRADTAAFTTMAAALGKLERGQSKVLILPCMNADMFNSVLKKNMSSLLELGADFITPRLQRGKLEYPGSEYIAVAVARQLSSSLLKNTQILLTAGPTPVAIDDVRRITNIFKGRLGLEIAKELVLRGANPTLLLGGSLGVPGYLQSFTKRYKDYEQYKDLVLESAGLNPDVKFAVLSSAVADYKPAHVHHGKISSKQDSLNLPALIPTEKVVELLHKQSPQIPIISFKLLSRVSEEDLIEEARSRLSKHSELVIANRFEDCSSDAQIIYLVSKDEVRKVSGTKRQLAVAIVDCMEKLVSKSLT